MVSAKLSTRATSTQKFVEWCVVLLIQLTALAGASWYEFREYLDTRTPNGLCLGTSIPYQALYVCVAIVAVTGFAKARETWRMYRQCATWSKAVVGVAKETETGAWRGIRLQWWATVWGHVFQTLIFIIAIVGTLLRLTCGSNDDSATKFVSAVTSVVAIAFVLDLDDSYLEELETQLENEEVEVDALMVEAGLLEENEDGDLEVARGGFENYPPSTPYATPSAYYF